MFCHYQQQNCCSRFRGLFTWWTFRVDDTASKNRHVQHKACLHHAWKASKKTRGNLNELRWSLVSAVVAVTFALLGVTRSLGLKRLVHDHTMSSSSKWPPGQGATFCPETACEPPGPHPHLPLPTHSLMRSSGLNIAHSKVRLRHTECDNYFICRKCSQMK